MSVVHGRNAYITKKCRCLYCTFKANEYHQAYRSRVSAAGLPEGDPRHGTITGYVTYKCRCRFCVAEMAAYRQSRKQVAPGA